MSVLVGWGTWCCVLCVHGTVGELTWLGVIPHICASVQMHSSFDAASAALKLLI